jgi:hypothetical protein
VPGAAGDHADLPFCQRDGFAQGVRLGGASGPITRHGPWGWSLWVEPSSGWDQWGWANFWVGPIGGEAILGRSLSARPITRRSQGMRPIIEPA